MQATSVEARSEAQAGDTTINRAIDRYHLAMELRRVRSTLEELEAGRSHRQDLLLYYKTRLAELRDLLGILEQAS